MAGKRILILGGGGGGIVTAGPRARDIVSAFTTCVRT